MKKPPTTCNGLHCRCTQPNCKNVHYADCSCRNDEQREKDTKKSETGKRLDVLLDEITNVIIQKYGIITEPDHSEWLRTTLTQLQEESYTQGFEAGAHATSEQSKEIMAVRIEEARRETPDAKPSECEDW